MRLGLFGGSFDPVHLGHLALARCCQQQADLDEVWFVPIAKQPFKHYGPVATDSERLEMLALATAEDPTWKVSRIEIDRGGISYTVDTLRQLHEELPTAELFFMMGADALHDLPNWLEPAEICRLTTPLVVARAGEPAPNFNVLERVCSPERVEAIRSAQVTMPEAPIASSTIRNLLSRGEDPSGQLPESVTDYIREHRLYR